MVISKNYYIGEGGTKIVYRHPDNQNVCIKFPQKKKNTALVDMLREIAYLKKHQEQLPWISPYLGEVECNLGTGYMYEMVRNEDGTPSSCLTKSYCDKNAEILKVKMALMYSQLIDEHAVVNDLSLNNLCVKKRDSGSFELILVDGFGNNNFIKIADYSKYFLIRKLNRKFSKVCSKMNIPADFLI